MLAGAVMLAFVLLGLGSWAAERRAQRTHPPCWPAARPPRWLAWLCGTHSDGAVDLERAARQLAALTVVVAVPVTRLLRLAPPQQAAVLLLAYALVALPGLIYAERQGRRAEWERMLLEGSVAKAAGGSRRG